MSGRLSGDAGKALEAFQSGQDVNRAVYGESGEGIDGIVSAEDASVASVSEYDSALDALLADAGETEGDEGETESLSQSDSSEEDLDGDEPSEISGKKSGTVEELVVTDDKGRRKKVAVDFNDRKKMRQYVQKAHGAEAGMRKFQAERDQARKQNSELEGKLTEVTSRWDALEKAYQSDGIKGLVSLLDGENGYSEFERGIIERYEARRNASPEQLELLDARDREAARAREIERIRRENEEFRKSIEQQREAAEMAALESQIHPVYDKYNFSGKLGNADDEALFNDMLWNTAMRKLEPYEEEGLEITSEMVDKAFGDTANAIRRRIRANADKRARSSVAKKKQEAAEVAERTVQGGVRSNSAAREARDLIRGGNITDVLRNWGKYGSVFGKK